MKRLRVVIIAAVLTLAGAAGVVTLLRGEGLDRAEKWVSLVGVLVSVLVGVAGLALGVITLRRTSSGEGTGDRARYGRVRKTGDATAIGRGSRANSGSTGAGAAGDVERTGDARGESGGHANTGLELP